MSLYNRVYNFSAGPGTLPVPVLERVREEMLNHGDSGMSVLEMSHRGGPYDRIHAEAQADLRALMGVPDDYHVLFLQGGASLQFTMLARSFGKGDYVVTGAWGEKAYESAALEGEAAVVWDDKAGGYRRVPETSAIATTPGANFVHITSNETSGRSNFGSSFHCTPPMVCDMSSDILSRPVDVARYGLIFAGAQKNMGPAGATLVLIHDDLLKRVPKGLPPMLDYALQAKNDSRYNTPPSFSIYVCGLVYKHLLALGGLGAVAAHNERKAGLIYDAIDASGGFYKGHAAPQARSTMNVVFTLPDEERTKRFVTEAESHGFDGLKGHRSVGGIRASIYNAFPEAGCEALAVFMREFVARNG